jgi:hypothetical protein
MLRTGGFRQEARRAGPDADCHSTVALHAAPGLTPDGEGGGDREGGASPDRNLSEVRWRPRVRPAQRASCGETMTNGGMDDYCPRS